MNLVTDQPVIVGAVVAILTQVAARYGFHVTSDVLTLVTAVVTAVVALVVRQVVTPVSKVAK